MFLRKLCLSVCDPTSLEKHFVRAVILKDGCLRQGQTKPTQFLAPLSFSLEVPYLHQRTSRLFAQFAFFFLNKRKRNSSLTECLWCKRHEAIRTVLTVKDQRFRWMGFLHVITRRLLAWIQFKMYIFHLLIAKIIVVIPSVLTALFYRVLDILLKLI